MASGVNDSGQVIGFAYTNTNALEQPFTGTPSGSVLIPLPSGWNNGVGKAINNSGQVTGYVGGYGADALMQAFIGTASGTTLIPVPDGWWTTCGVAINDSGEVVGQLYPGNLPGCGQPGTPFITTASGTTVIPMPPGANPTGTPYFAMADSINNAGVVVVGSELGRRLDVECIKRHLQLLTSLVPQGWVVTGAGRHHKHRSHTRRWLFRSWYSTNPWKVSSFDSASATAQSRFKPLRPGLQFSIGSTAAQIAPQCSTFPAGSTPVLAVATPQPGATGTQYAFTSWSDGGGRFALNRGQQITGIHGQLPDSISADHLGRGRGNRNTGKRSILPRGFGGAHHSHSRQRVRVR